MARPILFRGKPVKPQSYTVKEDGTKYVDFITGGFYRDFCYGGCPEGKDYIIVFNSTGLGFNEFVLVEKESVGQYTGLKDKKDNSVWENAIVYAESFKPSHGVVEFIEGAFCVVFKGSEGYPTDINHFYPSVGCLFEVVGNTTDNPVID